MNLIDYVRIIVRRGWIAVLLAVIAAASVYIFSTTIDPVFRSTQTVLIVPSRSDFGLTQAAVQLLNNRRAYLNSTLRAEEIIDELQLDMTPDQLLGATTIVAQRDNLTMQIDVDLPAPTAQQAAELNNPIALAWGNKLIQYQEDLNQSARAEDRIRASLQDTPRLSQLRPRPTLYGIIGGIAGLFLGVVIVLVLEYLESNVIRRREDIETTTGMKVLATVPTE